MCCTIMKSMKSKEGKGSDASVLSEAVRCWRTKKEKEREIEVLKQYLHSNLPPLFRSPHLLGLYDTLLGRQRASIEMYRKEENLILPAWLDYTQ